MLFVTHQQRTERLAICKACNHYKEKTRSCGDLLKPRTYRGGVKTCGCFLPAKVKFKLSSCPNDYWEAQVTDEDKNAIREVIGYSGNLEPEQVQKLVANYNKAIGANAKPTGCSSCLQRMKKELIAFLESDEEKEIEEATKREAALHPEPKEKKVTPKEGNSKE